MFTLLSYAEAIPYLLYEREIYSKLTVNKSYHPDNIAVISHPVCNTVCEDIEISESNIFAKLINGSGMTNIIDQERLFGLFDVILIDLQMDPKFFPMYDIKLLMYSENGIPQGYVWIFTSSIWDEYVGVYGIRASCYNILTGRKGIAMTLFKYIMGLKPVVIVPWPLDPIKHILRKIGFIEDVFVDNEDMSEFIGTITYADNYFYYEN